MKMGILSLFTIRLPRKCHLTWMEDMSRISTRPPGLSKCSVRFKLSTYTWFCGCIWENNRQDERNRLSLVLYLACGERRGKTETSRTVYTQICRST